MSFTPESAGAPQPTPDASPGLRRLWRAGRTGWALLALAGVLALLIYMAAKLSLLIVPIVLALFPATLLVPVASWLKQRGVPAALAALGAIVAGILLIVGIFAGLVPVVAGQLPQLVEAAGQGVGELREFLQRFGIQVGGLSELMERAQQQAPEGGEVLTRAMDAAVTAFETLASSLLLIVALFFYLKDGRRLTDGIISTAPGHLRPHLEAIADRSWTTLGRYFRGQLLVALVDAAVIGIGLVILGVPLALPLSVLIFFGGLFPVVGAVTTGALAVLVGLAHGGLVTGAIVLALVVLVQQLEGNVLEPVILGRAIHLHPFVVLTAITAGALLLGILGAFLAVPVAAILAVVIEYLRAEASPPAARAETSGSA